MGDKERGILLVYNDRSGPGKSVKHAAEAASLLSHARYPYDIKSFYDLLDFPDQVNEWAAVCVYGGDGSFFSAANIVGDSERKPALVAMPTGTENVMAKSINGRIKPLKLIRRTIATLNGDADQLNRITLRAGSYKSAESDPKNFYWILSAGDSGLTRKTLRALDERGPSTLLLKKVTALRAALSKADVNNTVKVTVFDEHGLPYEEFDALEASVIKKTPGKWSRIPVVPTHERNSQILTIGRGRTDYNNRRFIYRTLFDSVNAITRGDVAVFDPDLQRNTFLTRTPIAPNHTVIFTAQGDQPFRGTVTDSEINRRPTRSVTINTDVESPIIEVFAAL